MNEYLIQKETLTGLADEIRVLSGATAPISTEEMTSSVADANDEVSAQAATIAEISALLEGKGVPGGDAGIKIDTCTVNVVSVLDTSGAYVGIFCTTFDGEKVQETYIDTYSDGTTVIENVVCGTTCVICGRYQAPPPGATSSFDIVANDWLSEYEGNTFVLTLPVAPDAVINIELIES